ncbi:glycosyltransferase family 4 protein [Synechococcus sp. Cruz-9H2]|uniref:MraY family glycosyltransferase n=1 Tax=unclassified Synechococcus TaxID=2626047 RepID=UPI0020CCBB89|nr:MULTISPECIES: glycosyltransferase family 4 protein [unclassified Synechococcus]MCP9820657.1 glycosyltransferase family 4 protein [Synechococcus sp. Cruz-9H2]MCP9844833.1 glycosyltransferase family 4 protein [Synechococcus sp. Edmonson 11F2]MCP9856955.1 glycosyltransferase family 4 protein [Synechococcus sp. Cruz-9C9]MCP9864241.1 glycosyltransferase family 4 protein [Synechococcus sp. Cruz-7E5]MCP9871510.1 glycosyltransferase family 4 protein [Synechococcus sp. Cruz-7B9]
MGSPLANVSITVSLAAAASWMLLLVLLPWLRRDLLDRPNARSTHHQPTPRGGGVAFVLVSVLWGWPLIPLLCAPLALVGLLDDRLDLPAALRYGAQLATAVALLLVAWPGGLLSGLLGWLLLAAVVVAITAVINFFNFMDGLDGLVAGCSAVVFAVAAISSGAFWLWPLVGALLGFLIWNWSPARVFMGDVGSTFLGAVFAGVVLQSPSAADGLGLLLVAVPMLADAAVCVLRRLAAKQPVFQAHRLHLYQRLHQAGWSHRQVCLAYLAATLLIGAGVLEGGVVAGLLATAFVLSWGLWLERMVALPFAKAAR